MSELGLNSNLLIKKIRLKMLIDSNNAYSISWEHLSQPELNYRLNIELIRVFEVLDIRTHFQRKHSTNIATAIKIN